MSGIATAVSDMSGEAGTRTYRLQGDRLAISMPTGESYTATPGGPPAPFKGDPGIDTMAVRRLGDNKLQETARKDGKVVFVATMTLAQSGQKMDIHMQNMQRGGTIDVVATWQSADANEHTAGLQD